MMEMWDLYNERREKTGRLLERGKPVPSGLFHLVVSAWITNSHGQYLLSQRHPDKSCPVCRECTGGSVLAGESSLTGAVREVKEEFYPFVSESKVTLSALFVCLTFGQSLIIMPIGGGTVLSLRRLKPNPLNLLANTNAGS